MHVTLPLQEMTLSEKMHVMEEVWDNLSQTGSGYTLPNWHGDILSIRKKRAHNKETGFTDWEIAKKEIRDTIV
ncbi:MAG: addiction module protein [Chlorobium sp.]